MALGPQSEIRVVTDLGTTSSSLTGSLGYSTCTDGHDNQPCAFYLGSLNALAASTLLPRMTCDDGSVDRPRVSNLVLALSQPAFGVAEEGAASIAKGFPMGALVIDTAFDVNTEHFTTTRPNRARVVVDAEDGTFDATGLVLALRVPCNNSMATVSAVLDLSDPGTIPLESPPVTQISTPATVTCGVPTTLAASTTDRDNDLDEVRWQIDGVLIDEGTTSIVFTGPHTLEAFARDDRGATASDRIEIQCA